MCVELWGKVIRERIDILESWAHKQGLELAAECHLAKINQCADFLMVNSLNIFWVKFRLQLLMGKKSKYLFTVCQNK